MFGWELPPYNSGGLGVACEGIIRALKKTGTDIAFVLPRKSGNDQAADGITFADHTSPVIPVQSLLFAYATPGSYRSSYSGTSGSFGASLIDEVMRYGSKAGAIAAQKDHAVIHAHDWLSFPAGIQAKQISNKPLVAHVHATEFDRTGGSGANPEIFAVEKKGMQVADAVVAVSQRTKDMIVGKYQIAPSKVEVVHNGIDMAPVYDTPRDTAILKLKKSGTRMVLFVGRITIQKGPDYFMQVAKKVLKYEPNTIFIIAGSGDMEHQMINLGVSLGISHRVFFAGYLRGRELDAVYDAADVMVMPSVSEPFGITALEGLAHKTPTLISKQSGVSEVVSHALKTNFWDTDDMANDIIATLRYSALRNTLKTNGFKEASRISWDKAAHKYLQLYRQLQ